MDIDHWSIYKKGIVYANGFSKKIMTPVVLVLLVLLAFWAR